MCAVPRSRALPAIGTLVNQPEYLDLRRRYPHALVVDAIREQVARERSDGTISDEQRLRQVADSLARLTAARLRPVINATGVVLHTNLGRAPLSARAAAAAAQAAAHYVNLEYDLADGRRGERSAVLDPLLRAVTGAEAATVVNNNAGAVLLALTALCRGGEVIVSRGQLVEIGGSFRMPDVMRLSGARMVEVGTTNRTRLADYEAAIGPRTKALLRVHTSNFKITGFTETVGVADLSELGRRHELLLIDDLGSGALEAMLDEPDVRSSVRAADVVTFSGDKLLGGPQAGIAAGRLAAISRLARHPLARALRADKMTLAALEATLRERLLGEPGPVQRMLAKTPEELRRRAALWWVKLDERGIRSNLLESDSAAGGGSLPGQSLPTVLLSLKGPPARLRAQLRAGQPPVIVRVVDGSCCLDPRTVLEGEDETMLDAVEAACVALNLVGR